MKRMILTTLTLTLTAVMIVIFSGFNSGSDNGSQTDSSDFNATGEMIQGVFEMLPPDQGYVIYLDGYFLFIVGTSDSTMYSNGGKYEISGKMITDYHLFSTNPNMAGSTKWSAEILEGDIVKATIIKDDGSIQGVFKMVKKVDPTDELRGQMKDIEGFYKYVAPNRGLSTMLDGYYIYLFGQPEGTMSAMAGTYTVDGDKTTTKIRFATNPQLIGEESNWIKKSVQGNTLTWASINDKGEVYNTGQSVRPE